MYELFQKLLDEHGISAYKVAKETGISTSTLTSWKKGIYTPKKEKLQKIANFFGVSMDYFYTDGKHSSDSEKKDWILDVIIRNYKSMNEEGRKKLADYADDLVSSGKYIKSHTDRMVQEA